MNSGSKRLLLRCVRIAAVIVGVQLVLVLLVTMRLKNGYPGVVDVSDYIPEGLPLAAIAIGRGISTPKHNAHNSFIVPRWQTQGLVANGSRTSQPLAIRTFYLTQVLHVRIYKSDKAKWTIKELKQWMHYMYYAGVEHIFVCDHAQREAEKIDPYLANYIELNLATYIHWSKPRNVVQSKLDCYRYFMKELEGRNEWQLSVDMDEYPFVVADQSEGFLARYLRKIQPDVVQILMENYLMLDEGDRNRSMVIERIIRKTRKKANKLTKPLYRPNQTKPGMHRFYERRQTRRHIRTVSGKPDEIVMLHYWGTRLQRMGQTKKEVLDMTEHFPTVRDIIAPRIRSSLIAFGEFEAFSNTSGP